MVKKPPNPFPFPAKRLYASRSKLAVHDGFDSYARDELNSEIASN